MMAHRTILPLDPECPDVVEFMETASDPITIASGCFDDILFDFERNHRATCPLCMYYGLLNIELGA